MIADALITIVAGLFAFSLVIALITGFFRMLPTLLEWAIMSPFLLIGVLFRGAASGVNAVSRRHSRARGADQVDRALHVVDDAAPVTDSREADIFSRYT